MGEESPLLQPERKSTKEWRSVAGDLKRVMWIAAPMMVVGVSQYLVRGAPLLMLGHLGELSLSSSSIATSLCNATGFTVLFGIAGALETQCGQAHGAGQREKLGGFVFAAVASLLAVCVPISLLWAYADELLILMGQDPAISAGAGRYASQLIPSLLASAIIEPLVRFLLAQSLILPMLWTFVASLCIELPLCWVLVFELGLGSGGAALSVAVSSWFSVACMSIYVRYSTKCADVRIPPMRDLYAASKEFFRIGVPSALMFCLEGWTYELVILLSGLLVNPQLETSVVTMCYMIGGLHSYIPYAFSATASTLVSNELGAGKHEAARVAVYTILVPATGEFLIVSAVIYMCRHVIGYAFSGEKEVVDYVDEMTPFICILIIMDSLQSVFSGVVRGIGWQHIGAYVNLGAYYLIGLPVGLGLGFALELRGKGLLCGVVAGVTVQALSLSIITYLTNWEKQARDARQRIIGGNSPTNDVIVV